MKILILISVLILSSCTTIKDIKQNEVYDVWKTSKNVKELFSCFQERLEATGETDYIIRFFENDTKGTFSLYSKEAFGLTTMFSYVFTFAEGELKVQHAKDAFFIENYLNKINFKACI